VVVGAGEKGATCVWVKGGGKHLFANQLGGGEELIKWVKGLPKGK
jgi:hypothetical protein